MSELGLAWPMHGRTGNGWVGRQPRPLVAIANAGGVTIDWLATGRLPKTRAELRTIQAMIQPGAITGALMAEAVRDGKPFSIEQQRALGVDDDTFIAYLSGARLPTREFLMRFAEMTGCSVGPLLAAHDVATAMDTIGELELQYKAPSEAELLKTYRAANVSGKNALDKVASAIRNQTMGAWFSAGQAITEAANIFDKKK